MKRRQQRRLQNAAALAVGLAALWLWVGWLDARLARTAYATGYAMFATVVALAAYNVRKKLPALPLGTSAAWLQGHLYLGVGSAALMLLHTSGRWPNGWLETLLAAAYWATFASGMVGLYLTRTIPKQLARTSEEFVYERIPTLRRELLERSREAVLTAAGSGGATTLAEHYCDHIDPYLAEPRGPIYALRPTSSVRKRVMQELTDLRRFLSVTEQAASEKLFALIRKKDDLDFHESRQGMLKRWLFIHVGLTYFLLTMATVHGWLALSMQGGLS